MRVMLYEAAQSMLYSKKWSPQGPDALRAHLQSLHHRAKSVQAKSASPHGGTEQLPLVQEPVAEAIRFPATETLVRRASVRMRGLLSWKAEHVVVRNRKLTLAGGGAVIALAVTYFLPRGRGSRDTNGNLHSPLLAQIAARASSSRDRLLRPVA
jgi:hypothetical protein